jgi:outer membrane cobalamin receptor
MKTLFRFISFLTFIHSFEAYSQDSLSTVTGNNFYDMNLEELMNIKISIASVKELTPRESPGIVTLITSDDIKNLGARDLIDVLRVVPGFDFGMDVEGVVGIGVRGNWAHEGKILLLIDGQEMNENLYSSIQLGNHYPVDNIERIEIIRGPGSAMYGDFAEYAVINIITKNANELKGASFATLYGQSGKTIGHRNVALSFGDEHKDFSYSLSGSLGESNRSDKNYTDVYGNSYDMSDQSRMKNANANIGIKYKEYEFKGIVDKYCLYTRDAYQQILSAAYPINFDSYIFELKKSFRVNDHLLISPKFNYKNQTPWSYDKTSYQDEFEIFKINSQRYSGSVTADYDLNNHVNFISGAEYFKDIAKQKEGVFFSNNADEFDYQNAAFFAQTLIRTHFINFTAGARYNLNSRYSASFVPRFGVTKTIHQFHFKGLFSKAFRAPNTENIDLNQDIKPENTRVIEAETGYEINSKMMVTLNAFDITTKDPIVYYFDENTNNDAYRNFERTGTRGLEVEYKYKNKVGYWALNYSFYISNGTPIPDYAVPNNDDVLLAFPAHKLNFTSGIKINDHINLNNSFSFSGPRYGIVAVNELSGDTLVKKFKPELLANFNLCYENLFVKGLSASLGAYNFLNASEAYIQPYNNLHAPLPGNSREFAIKISYDIHFKTK